MNFVNFLQVPNSNSPFWIIVFKMYNKFVSYLVSTMALEMG